MSYTPLFIGPLSEGTRKDLQPFMLPDEAFAELNNAYEFRGVIYKKGGCQENGRLGIREEVLVAARGAGATVVNLALTWPPVEAGSIVITDGVTTFTDDGVGGFTILPVGNGVVNAPTVYAAGTINITFTAANPGASITALYFAEISANSPVMGLKTLDLADSVFTVLMAFDTKMSYLYDDSLARFRHIVNYRTVANPVEWTGTDNDFFWSANYENAFFATNNTAGGHFYAITNITQAANAVITIGAHNFVNGDQVLITNVAGMTQINGLVGTVTGTAAATITVNINSAAFGAYTGGGVAYSIYKTKVIGGVTQGDGIRWYDNGTATGWVNFSPPLDLTNTPEILQGALLIIPYHERLVCLNTVEGSTFANGKRYAQRARWSQIGSCFQSNIVPSGSTGSNDTAQWQSSSGRGGFADAPTNEEIVSCEFIKDTLMVFFERSTWILAYSGNPSAPFYWQKVNIERGSESTFSTIGFDDEVLTVGKDAIIAANPQGAVRQDLKIPDEVVSFANARQAYKRVHGIRDNFNEYVLWTYASEEGIGVAGTTFPNRILAYNYRSGTWAIFKDYYTTFGQYISSNALTWAGAVNQWANYNMTWGSPNLQDGFPIIVGGNSQGFVHQLTDVDRDTASVSNDVAFYIQNISAANPSVVTCIGHSFLDGDTIRITDVNGIAGINNQTYFVNNTATNTFTLQDINHNDLSFAGYINNGKITVVDQFVIKSKNFNPTLAFGKKTRVGYIDLFLYNADNVSEITLSLFIDEDDAAPAVVKTISMHDFKNANNQKFWTRVYVNQVGQFFTMQLSYSDSQLFDNNIIQNPMNLFSFIVWTSDAGRII